MRFLGAGILGLAACCAVALRCSSGSDIAAGPNPGPGSGTETVGIIGVFVDTAGAPVCGAAVSATGADSSLYSAITDRYGAYLLDSMAAGAYRIEAEYDDSALVALLPSVAADSITYRYDTDSLLVLLDSSFEIPAAYVRTDTMYAPGQIAGSVTLDAADLSGTQIYVPGTSYSAWTDAAGAFTISSVPPGIYQVTVARAGYTPVTVRDVVVHADQTTTVPPLALARDPVAPPPPPEGLRVVSCDTLAGTVTIAWQPVEVSDLAGYHVYLDTGSLGPRRLSAAVVRETLFVHMVYASPLDSRSYLLRYQVKAVDTLNDESQYSLPVTYASAPPAIVRTSITFSVPDTARQGQVLRVIAGCINPTRRNAALCWYVDTHDSAGLAAERTGLLSGTVTDTLRVTFTAPGLHSVMLDVTDDAGDMWRDTLLLSVGGVVVPRDTCLAGPALATARRSLAAAAAGGRLFAVGGTYDRLGPPLFTPTPTALPTMESLAGFDSSWVAAPGLSVPRFALSLVALGDTLFALGGSSDTADHATVESYDTAGGAWRILPARMPAIRHGMAACAVNGAIYVFGGITDNGTDFVISDAIDRYEPSTGAWVTVAHMTARRAYHQVVVLEGVVYALGGFGGASEQIYDGKALASVDAFNPQSNAVTPGPDMPSPRMHFGAVAYAGRIYVMGGVTSLFMESVLSSVNSWAPASAWRTTENNLPSGLHSFAATVFDNAIVVIGGSSSSDPQRLGETSSVWRYYP